MIKLSIKPNPTKIILFVSSLWICLFFIFSKHYIYTASILEEWFFLKGLIFYQDFASFHLPLGRLTQISLLTVTNWNFEIDPFLGLILGISTLFTIYYFGKCYLSSMATIISLIFFTLFFWYCATGILYFDEILIGLLLILTVFYLFYLQKQTIIKSYQFFLLGILISLTQLVGQIAFVSLLIIFIFGIYILIRRNNQRNNLFRLGLYFILGIMLPFIPFFIYFFQVKALDTFLFYNFTYYFRYAGYEKNLWSLFNGQIITYYIPLIVGVIIFYLGKKFHIKEPNHYLHILFLGLSTIPFIIFSVYHPHHLNYALPIMAILFGLTFDYVSKSNHIMKVIYGISIGCFIFFSVTTIIPWHISKLIFPPSFKIANDLYPEINDSLSQTIQWLKTNTSIDTKIMVVGTPLIYIKSNRLPASRPYGSLPYTWLPITEIKKEILSTPPSYWIVDKQFTKRLINDYKQYEIVNFLNQELNNHYKKQIEYETWQIWKSK